MKNLGRTIDQIVKLDPALENRLIPIKNRYKRYPSKTLDYWKDLLNVLNSDDLMTHPKRLEIRNILMPAKRVEKKVNSFDDITPNDKVLGVLPENIADRIRRHDRIFIEISKQHTEAVLTKNIKLITSLSRRNAKQEIQLKKIWFDIKEHFGLWDCECQYSIKKKDNILVLAITQEQNGPTPGPGPRPGGMVMMDPDNFKNFLRMLGINPEE
jgi:hypothetical protein